MFLPGTGSCYGNQPILTAKGKKLALMLLKGSSNFIQFSKLKAMISFHRITKYIIWRYGSSKENGDSEQESNIFLLCPYFLSLYIWHLLFPIQFLSGCNWATNPSTFHTPPWPGSRRYSINCSPTHTVACESRCSKRWDQSLSKGIWRQELYMAANVINFCLSQ